MQLTHRPLDLIQILNATTRTEGRINAAERVANDTERERRLQQQECRGCYYSPKIGGAAMTQGSCGLCACELVSGSTNIDRLCKTCAKETGLCAHCGADMEGKHRRKLPTVKPR